MHQQTPQRASKPAPGRFPAPYSTPCCEACGAGFLTPLALTFEAGGFAGPGYYCDGCMAGMCHADYAKETMRDHAS